MQPAVSDLTDKHRELLQGIDEYVKKEGDARSLAPEDVIFTRSEITTFLGWQLHQIKSYLHLLVDMEYLVQIGSTTRGATFKYRRNYNVPDPSNPLTWLISPEDLDVFTLADSPKAAAKILTDFRDTEAPTGLALPPGMKKEKG